MFQYLVRNRASNGALPVPTLIESFNTTTESRIACVEQNVRDLANLGAFLGANLVAFWVQILVRFWVQIWVPLCISFYLVQSSIVTDLIVFTSNIFVDIL